MSCQELIKYLSRFDPDENVSVLALNLEARRAHKISGYQLMVGVDIPVLLFELGDSEPLDDVVEMVGDA